MMRGFRGTVSALAVVLAVLAATGCSSDDGSSGQVTAGSTSSDDATRAGSPERFDEVLQSLRDAYDFDTRVELAGTIVTDVVGRNIAGDAEFTASGANIVVDVIALDSGVWSRTDGSEWTPTAATDVGVDPLRPLLDPTSRVVDGEQLTVTYPGAEFGLGAATIAVDVRIDGQAIELVYVEGDVSVRTRLEPASDLASIVAPG